MYRYCLFQQIIKRHYTYMASTAEILLNQLPGIIDRETSSTTNHH
jgi:hypothetical protein